MISPMDLPGFSTGCYSILKSLRCLLMVLTCILLVVESSGQSWKLTQANIDSAFTVRQQLQLQDSLRPAYHLTPPAGCMGDPNGGIYHDGWYHIFYGLQPFAFHPGAWYWAHARSKDLLHWEHLDNQVTPAFELGLNAIGSGSTIVNSDDKKLAFYSASKGEEPMQFWRAVFTDQDFKKWKHDDSNPVLTLDHPGLPPFDDFWRDPYVFSYQGRTFMIACADLFDEDYVPVPIFEAKDNELISWEYQGILFTLPKHRYRNLEVPEFRPIGDQWIFMASTDAPVDRVNYFLGDFDPEELKFKVTSEGAIDYSGHYYAQESILDEHGNLYLISWIPGWDREWLPYYMNEPLKNDHPVWNGCFAIPRKLELIEGKLIQTPVESLRDLRETHIRIAARDLPVSGPMTALHLVEEIQGDQLEINLALDLQNSAFCGVNLLSDSMGLGGLPIVWSGDVLNVDGIKLRLKEWKPGDPLELQVFIDKNIVEVFVNGGRHCVSRQVKIENLKGKHLALTALGGTAKLLAMEVWTLRSIN